MQTTKQSFSLKNKVSQLFRATKSFLPGKDEDSLIYKLNESILETTASLGDLEPIRTPEDGEVEDKEIQFRVSGDEMYELTINWLARVKALKLSIAQELEFSSGILQRWSIDEKELDDDNTLFAQMKSEDSIIDIDRLTLFSFIISSRDKTTNQAIKIDVNRTVGFLKQVIKLEVKIEPKNQAWFLNDGSIEALPDDQKLMNYTEACESQTILVKSLVEATEKPKSQIKKIYHFKYENNSIKKQFHIDEDIEVVMKGIQKYYKIPENNKISLKFNTVSMDPKKTLIDYMKSNEAVIIVELYEDLANSTKIVFLFNDEERELLTQNTQTIRELRDQACSLLQLEPLDLYSFSLDGQILDLSQKLNEVKEFDENSVLELFQSQTKTLEVSDVLIPTYTKFITVLLASETLEYTLDASLDTVGGLKKRLEKTQDIDVSIQILILLKNDEWQRRLIDDNERLESLRTEEENNIRILCKISRKFVIIRGAAGSVETFDCIKGALIQEQKKMFEAVFKVPAPHQIWTIGANHSLQVLEDNRSIEGYGLEPFDQANPIRVFRKINLTVCLSERSETLTDVPTYETIGAQKIKISRQLALLPQEQLWSYNEKELEDEEKLEAYFITNDQTKSLSNSNYYAVDLIVQNDLEYFGFTEKNTVNVDLFRNFFIESDEELDKIIESVSFNKKESSLQFRNKLLGLFFGTLKKHSMWENLISKIKRRTFDIKGVNLWKSNEKDKANQSRFNTQFLLYYFLNSGTAELNVEILKIMKMHAPVPLTINAWSNRFSTEGTKIVKELYWTLQKSFVITSVGFGGAENKVCGKTEFNNQVLFCNFAKDFERNPICQGQ